MPQQDDETPGNIRLTVELPVFVPVLLLGIALSVAYALVPQEHKDAITFLALALAGVAGVYSAFYVGAAARERYRARISNRDRMDRYVRLQRLHYTYRLLRELDSLDFVRLRVKLDEQLPVRDVPPGQLYDRIVGDNELHTVVRALLNLFEDIAVAVHEDFADERTVWRSLRTLVLHVVDRFMPYIEAEQKRYNDPTVFSEITKLAACWQNGRYSDGTRVPNAGQASLALDQTKA